MSRKKQQHIITPCSVKIDDEYHYQINHLLGSGGYGQVYAAKRISLISDDGAEYVVKIMAMRKDDSECEVDFFSRVVDEMKAQSPYLITDPTFLFTSAYHKILNPYGKHLVYVFSERVKGISDSRLRID